MRAKWLPTYPGAREHPSVKYQRPFRTALRNTWRAIRSHFRGTTSIALPFSQTRERSFTCMTLRLDDMLIHNLTHLFHAVGKIVCLILMPKAPIQCRKRAFLDDYPIHRALGAKPRAVTFKHY